MTLGPLLGSLNLSIPKGLGNPSLNKDRGIGLMLNKENFSDEQEGATLQYKAKKAG